MEYDVIYAAYLKQQASLDLVMEKRRASEEAQRQMRHAVRVGSYKKIEEDLKKKYGKA